ncbi:hypothetical protein [Nonomuraea sp. NPDC048901]|uniref:hypothetical protein n=1 Tax=Nonomuraea sp. NPDC048901 TaxID=3155627 RepID=UPI0033E873E0
MDRPPHRLGVKRVVEVHSLPSLLRRAREPLPPDCPDWPLLVPEHAVVPFLGRREELATLRAWADDPAPLSIAVLTGRGGTGKTRLAGELCTELAEVGWDAGFLTTPYPCATRLDVLRPTLLAVDHPEPWAAAIGELIGHLGAGQRRRRRVRILLLTREPADGEWWRRLVLAAADRTEHRANAAPDASGMPSVGGLPGAPDGPGGPSLSGGPGVSGMGDLSSLPGVGGLPKELNELGSVTVRLDDRPLTPAERVGHAAAAMRAFASPRAVLPAVDDPGYGDPLRVHLAALMRLRGDDVEGGELLSRFLMYEQQQWMTVWPDGHEPVDAVTARQAVALVTLTTPTRQELRELLSAVPGSQTYDRGLALGDWLARLFPGRGGPRGRLAPLGPEVVAEQFLAETEGLDALVLAVHDHPARSAGHLLRMLDVLRRSSERPAVRSALLSLLTARLDGLLEEAAAEPSARLGDQVEAALRPLLGDTDGDVERGTLVRCLCVYARSLLGRQRAVEALAQVERAADLCDELDEPVGAAMTYAVLGATLAALHRPHDALEAIAWSQAEATALMRQGRHADAVRPLGEAVAALERFASGDPVLMGHLANGLLMLGDALIEAGRVLEASVVLHRGTRVIEDDRFRAVAQARLDFCQTELGHHEEAEQARAAAPGAYEPPDSACRRAHR